ncbi:MAG: alpha/beta fold hydrolase [Myxococcales bacterium]
MKRLRGLHALLHDGVEAIVDLVQETHESVAKKPERLLGDVPGLGEGAAVVGALHGGIASLVYDSIRLVNRGVEAVGGLAVDAADRSGVGQLVAEQASFALDPQVARELTWWSDTAQSALNAWAGDFLARRENALSIPLEFFVAGKSVACTPEALRAALPNATGKLCIFVHGLGCTDATWSFRAREQYGDPDANYGSFLGSELGYSAIYVRYNTGLHISQNARALAGAIDALLAAYPLPVEELAIVGHSMGGLVARGAAHYAQLEQRPWVQRLRHLLCIGSPHVGASLERATNVFTHVLMRFDTPGTQVPAKLLNTRSAGIKDLRFGYVLDEDWTDRDPDALLRDERNDVPLVSGVTYGFIAATFTRDPEHPLGRLLGDMLVSVPSALGHCPEGRHVRFDLGEVVFGVHHIAMLNHPEIYQLVRRFLSSQILDVACEEVSETGPLLLPAETPAETRES